MLSIVILLHTRNTWKLLPLGNLEQIRESHLDYTFSLNRKTHFILEWPKFATTYFSSAQFYYLSYNAMIWEISVIWNFCCGPGWSVIILKIPMPITMPLRQNSICQEESKDEVAYGEKPSVFPTLTFSLSKMKNC